MVKKITFSIDESGEVQINVEGAEGKQCEKFTEPFETLLGSLSNREYKDSYYAEAQTEEALETGAGYGVGDYS